VLSFNLSAQKAYNHISESETTTIGYWLQGESVTYDVSEEHKMLKVKGDKKKELNKSYIDYDLTLSILDSTENQYKMEAFYTNVIPDANLNQQDKELAKLIEEIPILFFTDEFGKFDTLANIDDLIRSTDKMVDEILSILELDNPLVKSLIEPVLEEMKEPNSLTGLYGENILTLLLLQGGKWKRGEEFNTEVKYFTYNNLKIDGEAQVQLKKIDTKRNTFELKVEMEPDDGQLTDYYGNFYSSFISEIEKELDPESFDVSMNDKLTITYDLSTGWPKFIDQLSTIKVKDKYQRYTKEIKTIYSLKPY